MKKFLLLLTLFCALFSTAKATVVEIGDPAGANASNSTSLPFSSTFNYGWSQQIYTSEEIGMAGTINSLSLWIYSTSNISSFSVQIYMAEVDKESFESTSDWLALSASDLVFTGALTNLPASAADMAEVTLNLDAPFSYSGQGNLLIAVANNTGSWNGGLNFKVFGDTGDPYRALYKNQDASAMGPDAPAAGSRLAKRNVIALDIAASGSGPTCDRPTSVTVTDLGARSVSLTWEGGSGTYDVGYKAPNENDYTYYERNTTATSHTFSDLQPNTSYTFAVKSRCAEGESQPRTASAKTAIAIPYEQNFDAITAIPSDWKRYSGLYVDSTMTATRTSTTSGWTFTSSTTGVFESKHLYCYVAYSTYKYWVELPSIQMEGNAVLTFMLALTGSSSSYSAITTTGTDDRFIVLASVDEGATWTPLRKWDNTADAEYVFNNIALHGEEVSIDLSAYAGQKVMLAFYAESTVANATNYLHIDDVVIDFGRSCLKPTGLHEVAGKATKSSVQLEWDDDATADAWSVQYKKAADSEWTTVAAAEHPFTLTGLEAFTEYNVRVAALCDASDQTSLTRYCKEISVKTSTGVPYHEGFSTYSLPSDWKRYDASLDAVLNSGEELVSVTSGWASASRTGSYANGIFPDSTYHLYLNIAGDACHKWIVSPTIEIDPGYELSFDLALTQSAGGAVTAGAQDDDMFAVLVFDGDDWNTAAEWSSTGAGYAYDEINATPSGQTIKVNLAAYAGKNVQIAFYGESSEENGNNNLHISNVSIDLIPACAPALSLSFDNVAANTAQALWTTDAPGTWQYGYVANPADDFVPADDQFNLQTTATSVALEGLEPTTKYAFFVRRACEDASSDALVRYFTTMQIPAELPYSNNFETDNGWLLINGECKNQWIWGTAAGSNNGGTKALYVTDSLASGNAYVHKATMIYATKTFDFVEPGTYSFSFDWKGAGESTWDYIRVALVPAETELEASTAILSGLSSSALPNGWVALDGGEKLNLQSEWEHHAEEIAINQVGVKKVVIAWRNDGSGGTEEPAGAIDNFSISRMACPTPTGLVVTEFQSENAQIEWEDDSDKSWVYACLPDTVAEPEGADMTPVNVNSLILSDLTAQTTYVFYLRKFCGEDVYSESTRVSFTTKCGAVEIGDGYTEGFENYAGTTYSTNGVAPDCWDVAANASTKPHVIGSGSYYYKHEGSKALTFYGSGNCYAAMPLFVEAINTLQISFWMQVENASNGTLTLGYITEEDPGDFSTFQAIKVFPNASGSMAQREMVLKDVPSDAHRLAFRWYYSSQYSCCIDDIEISPLPACMKPTALVAVDTQLATTSAALDWTAGFNETNWLIRYKKVSDEEWTLVADSVKDHPFTIDGLESSSTYEAQVAAWCDINDSTAISEFTSSVTFTTLCEPWSIADKGNYTEGFEAYEGTTYNTNGVVPACWDVLADASVKPHVIGSGSYLYVHEGTNALSFYGNGYCYAAMPEFAEPLNTLRISFWAAWENVSNGTLTLGYITADDQATFHPLASYQGTTGQVMEKFVADLDTISADAARLVFRWYCGSQYSCCIDDVEVMPIPSCLEPNGLAANEESATLNSIELSWTPQGNEANWLIQYKKATADEWIYVADSVNTNPFTVTGLDASNTYNFRIAAWCNTADSASASPFSNAISAATACDVITAFPYEENFDLLNIASAYTPSERTLPLCWSAINTCTNSTYQNYPTAYYYSSTDYSNSTPNSLRFYSYSSSTSDPQDQYAILPEMEGVSGLRIKFNARAYSASYDADFYVGVMTDPTDASTFVEIAHLEPAGIAYEPFVVKLNSYEGQGKYIAFKIDAAEGSYNYRGCYIDDIYVEEIPDCLEPEGLALSDITTDGVKATWTNEEGAAWIYAVTLASEEEPAIDQYIAAQSNSVVISGLAQDNADYIFYLRKNCGQDVSELVSAPFHTKMLPAAVPYTDNFEDGNNWMFINGGLTNAWTYGEATHNGAGTHALYISNDNGVNNAYTTSSAVVVYAVKTFNFEEGIYTFQYDWKANGESTYDYLRVALVPDSIELTAGTSLPSGLNSTSLPAAWNAIALDGASKLNLVTAWQTQICRELAVPAGTYKVVFLWRDDTSGGTQEPAAIDNFSISKLACAPVKALAVKDITASSATIEWTNGAADQDAWQLVYTADPAFDITNVTEEEIIAVASNPYALSELATDTLYTVYVRANCGDEDGFSRWNTISFRTAKACQTPDDLAAADISINSAAISWNTYGQTGFNLRYGTDGTNWTVVTNAEMPYVLTGLTASTNYCVQVQAACAAEDETSWTNTFVFKTAYGIPFEEKFNTTSLPADWARYTGLMDQVLAGTKTLTSTTYGWSFTTANSVFDNHAKINIYGTSCNYWLATPAVYVEGNVQLTFDLALTLYSSTSTATPTDDDKFVVLISEDNGATWAVLRQWDNAGSEYVYDEITNDANGQPVAINLSEYSGKNIKIALYGESTVSGGDYNLHVDNLLIDIVPTCLKPSNLAVADIKAHSAELSWTAGEEGQTAWQIAYDTLPSNNPDTLTIIDVAENPYVLNGLDPETRYYVYVRANCGDQDGVSRWADRATFVTTVACPAPTGLKATITPGNGSIATLNWNAGDAQAWQVEYSLNSDMTDSLVLNVTEPVANLAGLTAEATYYARVKADCGDLDGISLYSAVISFVPTNKYELLLNDGTETNGYVPIYGSYVDEGTRSQFIIPEADLAAIEWDSITALTFYGDFTSTSKTTWGAAEFAVKMYEAPEATMSELVDWTKMTEVMAAGSLALVDGKMVINLDAPYQYQGGNLMIGIYQTTTGTWAGVNWYGVNANGASFGGYSNSVSQKNFLPKMNITYVPGVAPACPKPKQLAVSNITDSEATFSWKAVEGATWEYTLVAEGEQISAFSSTQLNTITIGGLAESTHYTFYLDRWCGQEDGTSEMISIEFTTEAHVAAIPFNDDFEGVNYWKFVADGQTNAWMVGNDASNGGEKALYVSNNGASYAYDNETVTATFATILINFDETGDYTIDYDWMAEGDYDDEELYDYMRVALVPAATAITAGMAELPADAIALDQDVVEEGAVALYGSDAWQHVRLVFQVEAAGDYKLVVAWFNDEADGENPGAIDNIVIIKGNALTDIQSGAGIDGKAVKFFRDNQVYIRINGAVYNITGQRVE